MESNEGQAWTSQAGGQERAGTVSPGKEYQSSESKLDEKPGDSLLKHQLQPPN